MRPLENPFARSGSIPRPHPPPAAGGLDGLPAAVAAARAAQAAWAARPVRERLAVVRALRRALAASSTELVAAVAAASPGRAAAETLTSEVIPLADACRFLEREAGRLLRPRRLGAGGRPLWLSGVELEVRREPLGLVLVVGPSNYPLFLPGVQVVQALTAGNAVLLKPGRGGLPAARALADRLFAAGLDERLLTLLPEAPAAAAAAMAVPGGPDKVVVTGSATTGRAILAELAPRLIPAILELSGCDACFILPGSSPADLERAARALAFGLRLNGGATCIAPRRVFVPRALAGGLEARLAQLAGEVPAARVEPEAAARARALAAEALAGGARAVAGWPVAGGGPGEPAAFRPLVLAGASPEMRLLRENLFAPVLALVAVADEEDALAAAARCPYALGATIFGPPAAARAFAARVRAGAVVVNDVIVPTADPRLPFGGRGASGFGTTRGAEGLLELTAVKAIAVRRGRFLPHLEPGAPGDEALFRAWLAALHGEPRRRLAAVVDLLRGLARAAGGRPPARRR